MSEPTSDLYETLTNKLVFIENCINLLECPESFREEVGDRLESFQVLIDEICQLANENHAMRDRLADKLAKLQENRKRIEELRKSKSRSQSSRPGDRVNSSNNQPVSEDNCSSLPPTSTDAPAEMPAVIERTTSPSPCSSKRSPYNDISKIHFASLEEFGTIPHYMRGRKHIEDLNKYITDINDSIEEKYNLIRLHRTQVPKDKLKFYADYKKSQGETTDIFITASDLGLKKFDKQNLNYLAMLRHIKRIKEVREGGIIKICILK